MSNHYLLVDDARRSYFDCEKLLLIGGEEEGQPDALHEQPFETWLRIVNWGDDVPEKTDRYRLALREGHMVYEFLVASGWRARIVSLDSDDYETIFDPWAREDGRQGYTCLGNIWGND
jgi:hypothetical protein